jgi:UDP:flavonoid glycosyltransferase YjiC (YdhE family)
MKILVLPFPLLSHYARCAELCAVLKDEHRIIFGGGCKEESFVSRLGFTTISIPQFNSEHVLECTRRFDFSWINESELTRITTGYIGAIKEVAPDLVISDTSQVARIACEATATPHCAVMNSYMSRHFMGFRGVPHTHPAHAYQARTPTSMFRVITRAAESISMRRVHRPFLALRRTLGLRATPHYLCEYEGDSVGIVDDLAVFPLRNVPPHYSVLGPLFHHSACHVAPTTPERSKRIVVSLGSSGVWDGLPHLADPIFGEYEIVLLGNAAHGVSAPHITSLLFAPPEEILHPGVTLICHGGNGTVYQGLKYGAKILCSPSTFEQEWNVAHFEAAGLATRLPVLLSVSTLAESISWLGATPARNYGGFHSLEGLRMDLMLLLQKARG